MDKLFQNRKHSHSNTKTRRDDPVQISNVYMETLENTLKPISESVKLVVGDNVARYASGGQQNYKGEVSSEMERKVKKKICFFSGDITRSGGTERVTQRN